MKDRPSVPWRVFGIIGLLIVISAFSALNLDHRADVSFGVYTFRGVPVFLTGLVGLTLGAVLVVPLTVGRGTRRNSDAPVQESPEVAEVTAEAPEPAAADTAAESGSPNEPEPLPAPVRRHRLWPFGTRKAGEEPGRTVADDRDGSGGSG